MEPVYAIIAFLVANKVVILGGLLAVSELVALIPSVKSNSVFQLVVAALKKAAGKKEA